MAYQNPFRSISPPSWAAGSSTDVISALQHPDETAQAKDMATMKYKMGLGPPPIPLGPTAGLSYGGGNDHRHGSGELTQAPAIHGFVGEGIPTNEFQDAVGRAPTADDFFKLQGSGLNFLNGPQMGQPPMGTSSGIPPQPPGSTYDADTGKWSDPSGSQVPPVANVGASLNSPFRMRPPTSIGQLVTNPMAYPGAAAAAGGVQSAFPTLQSMKRRSQLIGA